MLEPLCKARYLDRSPAPVPRRIERAPYVTAPDVGMIVVDAVRGNASPSNVVMSPRSLLRIALLIHLPVWLLPFVAARLPMLGERRSGTSPGAGSIRLPRLRGTDGSSALRAPR